MTRDQLADERHFIRLIEPLEIDHVDVAVERERAVGIEHVGDAAAHAGGEVAAGPPEHDHAPAGHVLAAVIADAFDHRLRAAVADREPLAGNAAHERLAARRAVQRDVADDHVLFSRERGVGRRPDDQPSARQALADEIVGLAFEGERDAASG